MMSHVISAFMFLTALILMTSSHVGADSGPKPCCLPEQFTALEQSQASKHWYKVSTDFTNNRKLVQAIGSNDFLYLDLASGVTYQSFGAMCTSYPTPVYSLLYSCAPPNTTLDVNAGVVEGEGLAVYSWKVAFDLSVGEVTVTQDKCYPVMSSLADRASGKSLYLTYSNVEEGVDAAVFDNIDLSNCSPSM